MSRKLIDKIYEEGIGAFFQASEEQKKDRDVVLAALDKIDYNSSLCILSEAGAEIRGDRDIVTKALNKNPNEMQYASEELKGDKSFILESLNYRFGSTVLRESIFIYASEDIRKDKDVIKVALKTLGTVNRDVVMENQLANVQEDDSFMQEIIEEGQGYLLKYASEELKRNRELVLKACRSDARTIQYASEELREDRDFLLQVIENSNGLVARYIDEKFRQDDSFMMEAIEVNPTALSGASERIQSNREVVLQVVKRKGNCISYASEELKKDKEVVAEAIRQSAFAIVQISRDLQDDREFMLAMTRQNGDILQYLNKEYKEDPQFIALAQQSILERKQHSSQSIVQGIQPRMGEIEKIESEIISEGQRHSNEKERKQNDTQTL